MARRKLSKQSEFKPDPRQNSLSGLFHVTQLQKQRMLKWTLYVLTGILLLTIQDVIMSRVSIFGATTDLPVVYILLITVIEGVDVGSLFVLFASTIYYFSAPRRGLTALAYYAPSGSSLRCCGRPTCGARKLPSSSAPVSR